jgi:hypothetical protein
MLIHMAPAGKGAEIVIPHDLNFAQERYEVHHDVVRAPLHAALSATLASHRPSRTRSPSFWRRSTPSAVPRTAPAAAPTPRSAAAARTRR